MMKQTPVGLTTEIIRDYPGSFVVEEIELRRLVADIQTLLEPEDDSQELRIQYLVGLKRGIIYATQDLELVLEEENAQSLRIMLLVVLAELVDDIEHPIRRIIVHFGRGKPSISANQVRLEDQWFNVDYCGVSYHVLDRDRDTALTVIYVIEERLNKFKRWNTGLREISVSRKMLLANLAFAIGFAVILHALGALLSELGRALMPNSLTGWRVNNYLYTYTANFVQVSALGILAILVGFVFAVGIYKSVFWLMPPPVIAIGDEIKTRKRNEAIRQGAFWTILVGGVVSLVVNLITR